MHLICTQIVVIAAVASVGWTQVFTFFVFRMEPGAHLWQCLDMCHPAVFPGISISCILTEKVAAYIIAH